MIIYLTCDEHLDGGRGGVDRKMVENHLREKHKADVRPYTAYREAGAKSAWVTRAALQDETTEFDFIVQILGGPDVLLMQLDSMMDHLSGRILPYDLLQVDVPPFLRK